MDSQRLILFFVFSFSVFMLLDAWQRDQQPVKPPAAVAEKDKAPKGAPPPTAGDVPVPSEKLAPPAPAAAATAPQAQRPAAASGSGAMIEV